MLPTSSQEQYANRKSRIPSEVVPGSPLQDARRRDFTVNTLFFNIQSEEVEDFTLKGLADLHNRRLVTPLDPYLTLSDDPLRLLRGVRLDKRRPENDEHRRRELDGG